VAQVTVIDDLPPTLSVPPSRIFFTGPASTTAGITISNLDSSLGTATASDNCSVASLIRTGVPAGNFFPIGNTTVTYTATDSNGLVASATQGVTVVDNTAPKITVPADRTFYTGAGATLAGIILNNLDGSLGTAAVSDNDAIASTVRNGVPGGNFFPIGTTVLTYTTTDKSGNMASATQRVRVIDNTPPKITTPADRTFYTGAGATLAGVVLNNLDGSLGTATVSDNDSIISTVRNGVPAGNFFPIGTTVLTYTTTDKSGNMASATQRVRVIDNTPPTITGAFVNPSVIWPPNNKMVDVLVSYNVGDNSAGSVVTGLIISSNEPTSAADMLVLDAHHVRVRADRAGNGTGRIYTIMITATDSNGNSFRQTIKVTVPHDQGK
jgi:HYR domain